MHWIIYFLTLPYRTEKTGSIILGSYLDGYMYFTNLYCGQCLLLLAIGVAKILSQLGAHGFEQKETPQ